MGNSVIVYDRTTIDFGASGVTNVLPGKTVESVPIFAGYTQTVKTAFYDSLEISIERWSEGTHPGLYRALQSFWSWAAAGGVFSFAADSAKAAQTTLTADPGTGNFYDSGDLEVWTGAAQPENWTLVQVGSTTFSRETNLEDVAVGTSALRFNIVGASQSTAMVAATRTVSSGKAFVLSFKHKHDVRAAIQYSIKNPVGTRYWTGSAWTGSVTWITATAPTNLEYALETQAVGPGSENACLLEISFRNAASGAIQWVDDVRLTYSAMKLDVRSGAFVATDWLRIISKANQREESVQVASVVAVGSDGAQTLTLSAIPKFNYLTRDLVRHADYFPFLVADQEDPAVQELPGSTFAFKLQCRELLTGRT